MACCWFRFFLSFIWMKEKNVNIFFFTPPNVESIWWIEWGMRHAHHFIILLHFTLFISFGVCVNNHIVFLGTNFVVLTNACKCSVIIQKIASTKRCLKQYFLSDAVFSIMFSWNRMIQMKITTYWLIQQQQQICEPMDGVVLWRQSWLSRQFSNWHLHISQNYSLIKRKTLFLSFQFSN